MAERHTVSRLDHKNDSIVAKIHSIFQRSYRKEAEIIGVRDFPPLRRTTDNLRETDAEFFGCWENGDLVAAIEVTVRDSELSINSLVVDPLCFRRGYAGRLLDFVLDSLVWETAVVQTAVANGPAIALYKKFGFVEARRWQTADGISLVLLRTSHQRGA